MTFNVRMRKLKSLIADAKHISVLTGAGVSTDCGIPDFRSKNGLYNAMDEKYAEYQPEYLLSHDCFLREPKIFYGFYKENMDCRAYGPGPVHKWLARLEQSGKRVSIATQNIDGLHSKAGSSEVYEIHGSMNRCHCTKCGRAFGPDSIFNSKELIPRCPDCKSVGFIRPDIVLYNEPLPMNTYDDAYHAVRDSDLMLVMGTSLTVHPACDLPCEFQGDNLVIMNNQPTSMDEYAQLIFHENLRDVVTEL